MAVFNVDGELWNALDIVVIPIWDGIAAFSRGAAMMRNQASKTPSRKSCLPIWKPFWRRMS